MTQEEFDKAIPETRKMLAMCSESLTHYDVNLVIACIEDTIQMLEKIKKEYGG